MGRLVPSSKRTAFVVVLTWALIGAAAAPATAQEVALTDEQIASLGTTTEELAAVEPNPSWADLGFFGDDALRDKFLPCLYTALTTMVRRTSGVRAIPRRSTSIAFTSSAADSSSRKR